MTVCGHARSRTHYSRGVTNVVHVGFDDPPRLAKEAWTEEEALSHHLLNFTDPKVRDAVMEAFYMRQWHARNRTLACVVPAMFIAGGSVCFDSTEAVLRHLGPKAHCVETYSVASVSGPVLAVCSCSVLPMFAGSSRVGAGRGPAAACLYSGPANHPG